MAGGASVADARAQEGDGAVLAFAVRLDRAASGTVTVDYRTADGTAKAGADYTATSGTLTFAAGETSKTVRVPVLDDAHDDGEETMTLRLSNASGVGIADGEAVGTIENADPIPAALLARFGRATAEQVVDQVGERMVARREEGFRAQLAGREYRPGRRGTSLSGSCRRLRRWVERARRVRPRRRARPLPAPWARKRAASAMS